MNLQKLEETMMKTRMKKLLAGMCAVLILPIGSAQTVLAEEPEQNFPISVEKAVNQTLKLWYGSPAKINTAESSGGEWMQQSLPLGNGNLGNLIFGGISKERIHFNEKTLWTGGPSSSRPNYQFGNKATAYTAQRLKIIENCLMTNLLMYLTMTKVSAVTVWGQKSDFRAKTI